VKLTALVDVSISRLPLVMVASQLHRLCGKELLVPASKANRVVSVRMRKVRFRTAIKRLGLKV
jgi:hypothetical protein